MTITSHLPVTFRHSSKIHGTLLHGLIHCFPVALHPSDTETMIALTKVSPMAKLHRLSKH